MLAFRPGTGRALRPDRAGFTLSHARAPALTLFPMASCRRILGLGIGLLFAALLAACTRDNSTGTDQGGTGGVDPGGDSPYANVVGVATSGSSGSYDFNVSVESTDVEDCDDQRFANWWEVLSVDGALLFRRVLDHPHTDENCTSDSGAPGNTFTRGGGPVEIADDEVVIVRAHMSNAGYSGMAMRGSVAEGFKEAPDIGPDFAADVEDDDPQPTTCYLPSC